MKKKLSRIHSPWQRFLIKMLISSVWLMSKILPRPRIHWIDYTRYPPRPERFLFILLFIGGMFVLEPHDFAYWAALVGAAALFVVFTTVYLLFFSEHRIKTQGNYYV